MLIRVEVEQLIEKIPDNKRTRCETFQKRLRQVRKGRSDDSRPDDGQEGGVKGGVAGGMVGGVVGAPVPVPKDTGPRMVSPQIARQQLLRDPNAAACKVTRPPPPDRTGMQFPAAGRIGGWAHGTLAGWQLGTGPPGAAVAEILLQLASERQAAVMVATHDLRLKRYASRCLVLEDGTLANRS